MSEIQISLSCQNNYLLTVLGSCPMQKDGFAISASKPSLNKFDCHSQKKSDKFVSASKSAKAFQDSLRNYEPNHMKNQINQSPIPRKINFVSHQFDNAMNQCEKTYLIDLSKKIKRVQSPFKNIEIKLQTKKEQHDQPFQQENIIISSFMSISEKNQESNQSSYLVNKMIKQESMDFQQITDKIQRLINDVNGKIVSKQLIQQPQKIFEQQQSYQKQQDSYEDKIFQQLSPLSIQNQNQIKNHSSQQSCKQSSLQSSKNNSKQLFKQKRKIKKRMIKKQKKRVAKQMKQKLNGIEIFIQNLRNKNTQIDRKKLIQQLKNHLSEKRLTKLKNELKKLL